MTPDEVNAAIATLRGYGKCGMHPSRILHASYGGHCGDIDTELQVDVLYCTDGGFCSSWALAGPLLDELSVARWRFVDLARTEGSGWLVNVSDNAAGPEIILSEDDPSATECIARAWLAWKGRQP